MRRALKIPPHITVRPLYAAIVVLLVALIVIVARSDSTLLDSHRPIGQTDLVAYYSAARLVLHEPGADIYNLHVLQGQEISVVYPAHLIEQVVPMLAPPFVPILLVPVTVLSYASAYALWTLLNVLLLGYTLVRLLRYAGVGPRGILIAWVLTLAWIPTFMALGEAQVSIVLLAIAAQAFFDLQNEHFGRAGILIAFMTMKPPYVLPLLIALIALRQWRTLSWFAVTVVFLVLAATPFIGPSTDLTYFRSSIDFLHLQGAMGVVRPQHLALTFFYDPRVNFNLAGAFKVLLAPPLSTIATVAADVLAVATLAAVSYLWRRMDLSVALALTCGLLVTPHVLVHDLVLLLIPIAVALRHRTRGLGLLLAAGYFALETDWFFTARTHVHSGVLAVVGLFIWLVLTGEWLRRGEVSAGRLEQDARRPLEGSGGLPLPAPAAGAAVQASGPPR